jgi:putative ABC transport system ATP-binding protein
MIMTFQDVTKKYVQGKTNKESLADVNLKIKRNSINLILGPSGSGKSTLINLASLITEPSTGEILFNDMKTSDLTLAEKSVLRRKDIGLIHQRDNLFPFLNMLENVEVPLLNSNHDMATKILDKVGFTDYNTCPRDSSPLLQQKVALARALVNNPLILLADEPTGDLNHEEALEFIELMEKMTDKTSVLMVSNNYQLKDYFENVFHLKEGSLHKKAGKI